MLLAAALLLGACRCPCAPACPSADMAHPDLRQLDLAPACLPPSAPCSPGPGPQCCDGIACGPARHCLP